jgi:Winged helix-turn helix
MRTYRRLHVRLSKGDREKLDAMLSGGVQAVRTVLRGLVLRRLDEGRLAAAVAAEVRLTSKAVREIGRRYEDRGLEQALHERPRPGAIPVLDHSQKQRICGP